MNVSLIMETENLSGGGRARALRMMDALVPQLVDRDDVELIVVFDEGELSPDGVRDLVEEGGLTKLDIPMRYVGSHGLSYYDAKNVGSRSATADTLVFVDCDVLVEPGWFDALLAALKRPDVDAVGGNAYVGPLESLTDKAFAAFWFFSLRDEGTDLKPAGTLNANNMAVARDLFLEHPFPSHDELDRGLCTMWGRARLAEGRKLWRAPTARAAHPSPRGYVFKRGLWRGHDRYLRGRDEGKLRGGAFLSSLRMFAYEIGSSARRILQRRKRVGLRWYEVPGAYAIALYYYTAEWVGFLLEWSRPGLIRRRFPI